MKSTVQTIVSPPSRNSSLFSYTFFPFIDFVASLSCSL